MALLSLLVPLMRIYGDGPWALCWPRAGAVATTLRTLQDMGAPPSFVLASHPGATIDPELRLAGQLLVDSGGGLPGPYREFLRWEQAMAGVDPAQLDGWDPERRARVLAPTGTVLRAVAGREVWGAEDLQARQTIEDKTRVVEIFEKCGLDTAPARVCPLEEADQAAAALDQGHGTVWAGDTSRGIDGGGVGTQWVHEAGSREAALQALGPAPRKVRVMPFLPGVPCAVQGFCTADGVAVFEPMEMVVLAEPGTGQFHFCGMATLWEPPAELRAHMRAAARTVGTHLAQELGWVGGFSLDGIATAGGRRFVPTEINARFSGGLSRLDTVHGGPPLAFVHRALWAGLPMELPAGAIERAVGGAARSRRICGVRFAVPQAPAEPQSVQLSPDATLLWKDGEGYGTLELQTDPLLRKPGAPTGPEFCRALETGRRAFGLALGPMVSPAASA